MRAFAMGEADAFRRKPVGDPPVEISHLSFREMPFGNPGLVGDDDKKVPLRERGFTEVKYPFAETYLPASMCVTDILVDDTVPIEKEGLVFFHD